MQDESDSQDYVYGRNMRRAGKPRSEMDNPRRRAGWDDLDNEMKRTQVVYWAIQYTNDSKSADGTNLAGIDNASGGYPWCAGVTGARFFSTKQQVLDYIGSDRNLRAVKVTITVEPD